MSTDKNSRELLSSFLDGETLSDEELERLLADDDALDAWAGYTLQRACLRGEPAVGLDSSFAAKIDAEPAYAVRPAGGAAAPAAANDEPGEFSRGGFWRGLGRVAVAASVACLCVVSAQHVTAGRSDDFRDASVSNSGMAIAPVSNTVVARDQNLPLSIAPEAARPDDNGRLIGAERKDGERLEKLRRDRLEEMNTLEVLMNVHDNVRRNLPRE